MKKIKFDRDGGELAEINCFLQLLLTKVFKDKTGCEGSNTRVKWI